MIPEYGLFALDPGLNSAMAWGIVRDEGSVGERLLARRAAGSDTIKDIDWRNQARVLYRRLEVFTYACARENLPTYFACEDFILLSMFSSDKTGLYPVWVGAALDGYRAGMRDCVELAGFGEPAEPETYWQRASEAKTYCTDERLRSWGLWVKGREHERDAWRHFAFFVADAKRQRLRLARASAYAGAGG